VKRRACARSEVGYGLAAKQTERSGDLRSQKADHSLAAERSGAFTEVRESANPATLPTPQCASPEPPAARLEPSTAFERRVHPQGRNGVKQPGASRRACTRSRLCYRAQAAGGDEGLGALSGWRVGPGLSRGALVNLSKRRVGEDLERLTTKKPCHEKWQTRPFMSNINRI
jgi:hypothetical protein